MWGPTATCAARPSGRAAKISGQAIELSSFATIAVVMVGGALMGVLGAILAVPVAGSLKVIFRAITADRRARMDALREQQPPQAT